MLPNCHQKPSSRRISNSTILLNSSGLLVIREGPHAVTTNRCKRLGDVITALALPLSAVAIGAGGATSLVNVNVVGYSVVGPAFKALEAAFQATSADQNVTFTNSFGASDTQTTNVVNGQPADLVNLSYGSNMASLVSAHKVASNWSSQELMIHRRDGSEDGTIEGCFNAGSGTTDIT